jgi:hypothetical protein
MLPSVSSYQNFANALSHYVLRVGQYLTPESPYQLFPTKKDIFGTLPLLIVAAASEVGK